MSREQDLEARVADLEAADGRMATALQRHGVHDNSCPCYPTIPHLPVPAIGNCTCGLGAALSDTGEGWLSPEVREQVREAIAWVIGRATPAGEGAWRIPRTSLERLGAALDALEVK